MNLAQWLARAARVFPDQLAIAAGDAPYATYAEFARRASGLAASLRGRLGLAPGDRVGLVMANCPEYLEVLWGCWWAGLAAVPVNAKLHPKEIAYILDNAGVRACFATPVLAQAMAIADTSAVRIIDTDSPEYRQLRDAGIASEIHPAAPDDLAWLFYTSGTTGRPKGVMLTHRNLLVMTLSYFADVDAIAHGDALLHAAPMSHGSGLYGLPHVARAAKQVIATGDGFDPAAIFDLASVHKGLALFAAPTMVKRMVSHLRAQSRTHAPALDNLKTIVYGGGPMYLADIKDALAVMGPRFAQIYGQGESPMTITALSKRLVNDTAHPRYDARLASVGVAHSVVEVCVADGEDRPLPPGELGEVLVRGDVVMPGYWRNPEATATTLRNGWLHTGDVGVLDADGFLTLKDRSKDLIVSGGANIYPREVEEVLLLHPGVAEVTVVGRPHVEWGEEAVAFIVAAAGASVTNEALDRLCLDNIARFKRPKAYYFVDSLPKNNYGKVLKTELRERLRDMVAG